MTFHTRFSDIRVHPSTTLYLNSELCKNAVYCLELLIQLSDNCNAPIPTDQALTICIKNMFPATTLTEVKTLLGMTDRSAIPQRRRMIGLVFARAFTKFGHDEVLSQLDYFHCRSGTHIDFFCAGVTRGDKETVYRQQGENDLVDPVIGGFKEIAAKPSGWLYSDAAFCKFCEEVESRCDWRYTGETDLLLLDAELGSNSVNRQGVKLDFSEMMVVKLEELKRSELITSAPEFFEKIIDFVKPANAQNSRPTFNFSDAVSTRAVGKLTFDAIVKLLPGVDAKAAKALRLLTTRNLGVKLNENGDQ